MAIILRIAVASRDGKTVAGHVGKCRDWIVFEAREDSNTSMSVVNEVERITLPKELVFHHYADDQPHPLANCAAIIGASAGDSFISKMNRRGIDAVMTAETDPAAAALAYLRKNVVAPKPRPIGELICKLRDALSADK